MAKIEEKEIKKIIKYMEKEGKRRNAPVYSIKLKDRYQKLIFIILSARTRDEKTMEGAKRLFKIAPNFEQLSKLNIKEIEKAIYGIGFYKTKAKKIKECAKVIVKKYKGRIPRNFEELIKLPGVGRKTANVFLASAFDDDRIGVDTHVHRISNRLGWINTKRPEETEKELKRIIPKKIWKRLNKAMVGFGQKVCTPKKPKCGECKLKNICKYFKETKMIR